MSDIDELLEEQLKDAEFAKAWEETDYEYQIKRAMIIERVDNSKAQKC
jgi:hypothetical protein